jgi:hypothetical protein
MPSGVEPPVWLTQALAERLRDFHARVRSGDAPGAALQAAGLRDLPLLAREAAAIREPVEEFLNDLRNADPEAFAHLTPEDMEAIAHMAQALGRKGRGTEDPMTTDTLQDS